MPSPASDPATATAAPTDALLHRQIVRSAVGYAIVTCDAAGHVTSWSEGAERMLGWTAREMAGQTLHRIFTGEDRAAGAPEREMAQARAQGHAADERWHLRKDGTRFWASGEVTLLHDDAGRTTGFVKVLRDETAQRRHHETLEQANTRLRESEARRERAAGELQFLARASEELAELSDFQATLEKITRLAVPGFADWCAVDMVEPGGRIQRVAVAHVDPQKVALAQRLHAEHPPHPRHQAGTWKVLRQGAQLVPRIGTEALDELVPDAQWRRAVEGFGLYSYIGAPLTAHGQVMGVLHFLTAESQREFTDSDLQLARDLARRAAVAIENAKLLRALQDSDRAKDVFLATLAHELRNPLAPIWNGLSIIKHVSGERARVEQVTALIERQVGQLSRLVDDLLDVSRIGTGKIELKMEPTNLVDILTNAVEMSRPHIEAAHHKLSLHFTDAPTDLVADPARMAQVFANLLNNAAKYTRRGGRIDVTVEATGGELVVRVRDTGVGIAPHLLGRVFGLFTQLQQPGERRQGGLGIGLSLVEGLVRLHGGRVEAHSAGVDQGSEFAVYLPRRDGAQPPVPSAAAPRAPAVQLVPRRVLVVDDNIDAASTVATLLQMSGNEVAVVHDGAGAVAHTAQFRPDVVLLDIGLPDIDGYEAARRIRKLEGVRQPTLIALTGWGQQQDKQQAAQAGFDQHWTKPVDPERLRELAVR